MQCQPMKLKRFWSSADGGVIVYLNNYYSLKEADSLTKS